MCNITVRVGGTGCSYAVHCMQMMSDFKVLLPNHHVSKGQSLMIAVMDVDLLLGIEQALMLHSVSIIAERISARIYFSLYTYVCTYVCTWYICTGICHAQEC